MEKTIEENGKESFKEIQAFLEMKIYVPKLRVSKILQF